MKSKVIAVTGGIGSGKSEVLKYLSSLGYFTVDCDVLAKEVSARAEICCGQKECGTGKRKEC